MRVLISTLGLAALLWSLVLVGDAAAQRGANVPGIIGGAIEGNVPGAAGAAMGYDYYGRSGYYPGARGNPYGYNDGYGRYGNGRYGYDPYGRYGGYYGRSPRYYDYDRGYTTYRRPLTNPVVEVAPYRAVVVNDRGNSATLNFAVNGQPYQLQPGQQMEFSGTTQRTITFDRGQGEATARYTLADGRFLFAPTDRGWELYRHPLTQPAESVQTQAQENLPAPVNPQPEAQQQQQRLMRQPQTGPLPTPEP